MTVSGSSGSESQSTKCDDENVLSERRVKHGDRLSDGKMRCTEVLRRANVSEMKILIETVVMKEKFDRPGSKIPLPFICNSLKMPKRPIPEHKTAPRIPQAGDLSPGHLRHGHGKAI